MGSELALFCADPWRQEEGQEERNSLETPQASVHQVVTLFFWLHLNSSVRPNKINPLKDSSKLDNPKVASRCKVRNTPPMTDLYLPGRN